MYFYVCTLLLEIALDIGLLYCLRRLV
jgi:hypothetical protein